MMNLITLQRRVSRKDAKDRKVRKEFLLVQHFLWGLSISKYLFAALRSLAPLREILSPFIKFDF
jgi:hypothetical protein